MYSCTYLLILPVVSPCCVVLHVHILSSIWNLLPTGCELAMVSICLTSSWASNQLNGGDLLHSVGLELGATYVLQPRYASTSLCTKFVTFEILRSEWRSGKISWCQFRLLFFQTDGVYLVANLSSRGLPWKQNYTLNAHLPYISQGEWTPSYLPTCTDFHFDDKCQLALFVIVSAQCILITMRVKTAEYVHYDAIYIV